MAEITNLINFALQQSNDIESHGRHKVNSPQDLADSLLAWKFITDTNHPHANYPLKLTLDRISFAHWLITHNQMPEDERGVMRHLNGINVSVGGRIGTKAQNVGYAMMQWLDELKTRSPKESHIAFEHIHPFADGNGRTGRLLYYWQLSLIGELTSENIILDAERESYYSWF